MTLSLCCWHHYNQVGLTNLQPNSILNKYRDTYTLKSCERLKGGGEGDDRGWDDWWHHQLNGHEFEETLGDGEGQGILVCCSPWGHAALQSQIQLSNWTTIKSCETWTWAEFLEFLCAIMLFIYSFRIYEMPPLDQAPFLVWRTWPYPYADYSLQKH